MSYYFDGVDDKMTDGTNGGATLNITAYTVMAWVKWQGTPISGHIMGRATSTHTLNHMMLRANNSDETARQNTTSTTAAARANPALLFQTGMAGWDNVIASHTEARSPRWDYYLNGNNTGVTYTAGAGSTVFAEGHQFSLGGVYDNLSRQFAGRIAHVCIWNRVLTSGEIAALAAGGNPQATASTGLIRYWPLTVEASTQVDLAGSGHNLAVTGAVYAVDDPPVATVGAAPLAPVLVAPADGSLSTATTFDWDFVPAPTEPSDTQTAFAFRRGIPGSYQWWDGTTWVGTETFITSSTSGLSLPPGAWA
jgi:hypothetical protein